MDSTDDDTRTELILSRILAPESNCIDVGANAGQILRHIVRLAPRGRHHAFEPIPALAAGLRLEFPSVTVVEAAASDRNGTTEFHHVVNDPGYSGIRRRRYDRPDPQIEMIEVALRRVDEIVLADLPIRFIKVDVEGAELEVLRGASGTIRSHRPFIIFEHGKGGSEFYGTRPADVFGLLACEMGLRIATLAGWIEGAPPLTETSLGAAFDSGSIWNFIAYP